MRFIIYGAGAIGGTIGARLHLAGSDVLLIARGAHHDAIKRDGLRYRSPLEDRTLTIAVASHPREIDFRPDDVVILTMKSQHTAAALNDLAACAPVDVPVICCQNGVANESMAARRFRRVYAMVVQLPATHMQAGEVLHHAAAIGGILDAGCFPTGTDAVISAVCTALTVAGFSADADPRPLRWKYAKLLQNLGNALQAVCAVTEDGSAVLRLLRDEALACYAAAGIDAASREDVSARHGTLMRHGRIEGAARGGGSSWQSLVRGTGDIEADFLNGEICLLGRLHGIPTPANEVLRHHAGCAARERWAPGRYTVAEVISAIEALKAHATSH